MKLSLTRRRLAIVAMAIAMAAGAGAATGTVATLAGQPEAAHAASSVGGQISRSEVLSRARYWYDNAANINYDSSGNTMYPDSSGRLYRTDCSGFVSMAWHLSSSLTTATLPSVSTAISRSALQPGDLLDINTTIGGVFYHHAILFGGWESDGVHFWYYSFGSNPVKKVIHRSFSDSTLDGNPTSGYNAYRYNNIVNSAPLGMVRDFSGDGDADILARSASSKDLYLYQGNGAGGFQAGAGTVIGTGWGSMDLILSVGDFDGDGDADLIARNGTTQELYLYEGNGAGGFEAGACTVIGTGWGSMDRIF